MFSMNILRYILIIIEQARCVARIRRCGQGFIGYVEDFNDGDAYMEYVTIEERLLTPKWRVHWNYLLVREPWEMKDVT